MNAHYVGFAAAFLTMFGFVPQLIKIYRTKSSRDVSVITLMQFALGITLWLAYGIMIRNPVIILANGVTLATLAVGVILYFKYRNAPCPGENTNRQ